ncbi:unnamed protein product [Protopolystoma xenopodis]|uniref:Uncharacterized protein n=1 Tax=Protopolystoma xenopodis TaxID=117903 RepID=A0A3S5CVH2_9PLAT|nr:unnamed protein product [Protopolystoma xenopodis]
MTLAGSIQVVYLPPLHVHTTEPHLTDSAAVAPLLGFVRSPRGHSSSRGSSGSTTPASGVAWPKPNPPEADLAVLAETMETEPADQSACQLRSSPSAEAGLLSSPLLFSLDSCARSPDAESPTHTHAQARADTFGYRATTATTSRWNRLSQCIKYALVKSPRRTGWSSSIRTARFRGSPRFVDSPRPDRARRFRQISLCSASQQVFSCLRAPARRRIPLGSNENERHS